MDLPLVGRGREFARFGELLRRGGAQGVVLFGEAGVGKSRLARAFLDVGERRGYATRWAVATRSGSEIPFGAFSHLLPSPLPEAPSQTDLLRLGLVAVVAGSTDRGLVVGVDDAHALDPGSATLVHQLALSGRAFLVVTVRSGEPAPDAVFQLWKEGLLERLTVEPLSREAVVEVVQAALGDRVERRALFALWRLSEGNPLLLRELMVGGIETGALAREGQLWILAGALTQADRVADVIAARLQGLDPEVRSGLELVAIGEPVMLERLETLVRPEVIEALETMRLVRVDARAQEAEVRAAHPLYAEVIDGSLAHSRRRAVQAQLADAVEAARPLSRDDTIRVANWRIESGSPCDPGLLVQAAQHAHASFDHELAERLGRAALNHGGGFEARLIVGEAISGQARGAEAERHFERLAADTVTDEQRARVSVARAGNLLFQLREPGIFEMLEQTLGEIEDPAWQAEVESMIVFAASYVGLVDRGIETAERLLARPEISGPAWLRTTVLYTYARLLRGRFEGLDEEIGRVLDLADEMRDVFPLLEDILWSSKTGMMRYGGDLLEAERIARERLERAVELGARELLGLWSFGLGALLSLAGDAAGAVAAHEEAVTCLRERDSVGLLPLSLIDLVHVHGLRDDRAGARAAMAEYRRVVGEGPIYPFGRTPVERAEAWLRLLEGDLDGALERSRVAGATSMETGELVLGMLALHDSVRWGRPEGVVDPLHELAGEVDGQLVRALAGHAAALLAGDAEALESVSLRFEAMGARLYAAESGLQAAELYSRDRGGGRRAQRARARASALAAGCREAATPALQSREESLLTDREQEIVELAVQGLASREIAERLVISVRTVDNHLASVYRKLGVTGRQDLGDVLDREAKSSSTS